MKMGKSSSNASNIGPSDNIHDEISCFDRKSSENDSEHRLEIGASVPSSSSSLGPPNNIFNGANSLNILSFQTGNLCDGVLPLQCFTHESYRVPYKMGGNGTSGFGSTVQQTIGLEPFLPHMAKTLSLSSYFQVNTVNGGNDGALELYSLYGAKQGVVDGNSDFLVLENLTRLPSVPGDPISNVHSGAPPPWLHTNEDIQTTYSPRERGGDTARSSKRQRFQKRRKPERVGAAWAERRKVELEKEKRGRLLTVIWMLIGFQILEGFWQSGSRKESRREFENERRKVLKTENVSSDAPVMSFKLQPLISKRMKRSSSQSNEDVPCHLSNSDPPNEALRVWVRLG